MHFHLLSFEGPDSYARAGGLASRVTGLGQQLGALGLPTHLWFVGDPQLPGHERSGDLELHRWCQWISAHHPNGVYDGEAGKLHDYASSLPPFLLDRMLPELRAGSQVTVLAEEWHTVDAVLHLDHLLRQNGLRHRVRILWNANNTFGFEHLDFARLARAATITTVSRYMKHAMHVFGVDPVVIPNGLEPDAYAPVPRDAIRAFGARMSQRLLLAKVARFDPDKRWLGTIDVVAELKRRGARPLLVARGGLEAHGWEVMERARTQGLRVSDRSAPPGAAGLLQVLDDVDAVDVVNLRSHVDAEARRLLFQGASLVLANSIHEPFGLVGLEAMAAGGIACTGISGEDYAVPGHNAVVLQTPSTSEAVAKIERVMARPDEARALRKEGIATARKYAWNTVIQRNLLPQIELGA
jgi:glycosyltransferase involved in cell wall biosynthesis